MGERRASSGDAEENDRLSVGCAERRTLDDLMGHSGDGTCDVTGTEQLSLGRFRRTAVARCHG
jgi:hypothetical protein